MATRSITFNHLANRFRLQRGLIFGAIIVTALFAFEAFNYGTTHFALTDLLGDLSFAGLSWATILAIAFCGIDFAGIARLFAPEVKQGRSDSWYLFGAWMLAATMNAMLTWWGVSLAILNHTSSGTAVIGREVLLRIVPVFVAVMVWLIRVLMIGTISISGDRLFSINGDRPRLVQRPVSPQPQLATKPVNYHNLPVTNSARINASPASIGRMITNTPVSKSSVPKSTPVSTPRTRTFTSASRSYTTPPEPDNSPDNEYNGTDPAYIPAPLAAKSATRPQSQPASDPRVTRVSLRGRKF
jgi:hypothetical protein